VVVVVAVEAAEWAEDWRRSPAAAAAADCMREAECKKKIRKIKESQSERLKTEKNKMEYFFPIFCIFFDEEKWIE
jgi:hypothetical protein